MEHRTAIRVYIEDTDTGGIVYYVNFLKFMERARTEMLRDLGYRQRDLQQQGVLFVVQSAHSHYLKPAHLDDSLVVLSRLRRLGAASLTFVQRVVRASGDELLCEAEIKVACVEATAFRPRALPREIRAALGHYVESMQSGVEPAASEINNC